MCELNHEPTLLLLALANDVHDELSKSFPRDHITPHICDCNIGAKIYFADIDSSAFCCARLPVAPGDEPIVVQSICDALRDWYEDRKARLGAAICL